MTREQLDHVIRAAASATNEHSFVVPGSQSVLLPHPDAHPDLLASREVDLYPAFAPEKFDETFGDYADGVGPETAVMPAERMDRAALCDIGSTTAVCPGMHDIAVCKCMAGREKDARFVHALLREGGVSLPTLIERIGKPDANAHPVATIQAWARRRAHAPQP